MTICKFAFDKSPFNLNTFVTKRRCASIARSDLPLENSNCTCSRCHFNCVVDIEYGSKEIKHLFPGCKHAWCTLTHKIHCFVENSCISSALALASCVSFSPVNWILLTVVHYVFPSAFRGIQYFDTWFYNKHTIVYSNSQCVSMCMFFDILRLAYIWYARSFLCTIRMIRYRPTRKTQAQLKCWFIYNLFWMFAH